MPGLGSSFPPREGWLGWARGGREVGWEDGNVCPGIAKELVLFWSPGTSGFLLESIGPFPSKSLLGFC